MTPKLVFRNAVVSRELDVHGPKHLIVNEDSNAALDPVFLEVEEARFPLVRDVAALNETYCQRGVPQIRSGEYAEKGSEGSRRAAFSRPRSPRARAAI